MHPHHHEKIQPTFFLGDVLPGPGYGRNFVLFGDTEKLNKKTQIPQISKIKNPPFFPGGFLST